MDRLGTTRRSLHGVAELLLAGPQFRQSGTIRLRATTGGFGTVREPWIAVREDQLLLDGKPVGPLSGSTYAELAAAAGVAPTAPEGLYSDGSGIQPTDTVDLDPDSARTIATAFANGDLALRRLAPETDPVLWPEHFDLGISLDEVNYGVSPGDAQIQEPYAYVGPWSPRQGPFWNVSFGAAHPLTQLPDIDSLFGFFREGLLLTRKDATSS